MKNFYKVFLFAVMYALNTAHAQVPQGCNMTSIRNAFAAAGHYTELSVPGQPCSMYFIDETPNDAATAEALANQLGGHLVVMNDATENTNVVAAVNAAGYLTGNRKVWIGYKRTGTAANTFYALDGSTGPFTPGPTTPGLYQNWASGEPNNSGYSNCCNIFCDYGDCYGEQCVQIYAAGTWNDESCDDDGSKSVIEVNLCPVLTVSSDTVICSGGGARLSASAIQGSAPYTFAWNPGNLAGAVRYVYPTTTTAYTATVTDKYGCYATRPVNVTVNTNCSTPQPVGCNINAIRDAFSAAGHYTELPVTGQDCSMYFIDETPNDAATAESLANQLGAHLVVMNDATENANVVAAINAAGYLSSGQSVWIGYKRTAAGANTFYALDGSTGPFLTPTTGGATPGIYQNWNGGEPNNSGYQGCSPFSCGSIFCSDQYECTNGEQCVQIYAAGTWNDLRCNRTGSKSVVEVNLCPQVRATNDTFFCSPSTTTITTSTILGSQPYSYSWTPGGQTTSSIVVSPTTTTNYKVQVTDRYACVQSDSTTITIIPAEAPVLTATSTVLCTGQIDTIDFSGTYNSTATFTWDFDGGAILSQPGERPFIISWSQAGTHNVSMYVTDDVCTSPTTVLPITVNGPPAINAGNDTAVCSGGTVQLGAATLPGYTYQWSPATYLNSATISSPNFSYQNTTTITDTFSLVVLAQLNGCENTDTVTVVVYPLTSSSIVANGPTEFCDGGSVVLTSNDPAIVSYQWLPYGETTQSITVDSSGQFSMIGRDAQGCSSMSNVIVTTWYQNPVVELARNGLKNESCIDYEDGAISLEPRGGLPPYIYAWSSGQSVASITQLPSGDYSVTVTDQHTCTGTASYTIVPAVNFIMTVDSSRNISCYGMEDGAIYTSSTGGSEPYSYIWSNGETGQGNIHLPAGVYSVTARDGNGCLQDSTVELTQPPLITLTASVADSVIPYGGYTQIDANVTPPSSYSYIWTPAASLNCSCPDPLAFPYWTTTYTLVVQDNMTGCTDTVSVQVTVDKKRPLYIPNAFTPNGDTKNDVWQTFTIGVKFFKVQIFDRWGEKVYHSNNIEEGWDGKFQGSFVSPGVYTYNIEIVYLDEERMSQSGTITVLR